MNLKFQLTKAFLFSLLSLIGFGTMAFLVSTEAVVSFDRTIISFVQGYESESLTAIMIFFTTVGSMRIVYVIAIFVILFLFIVLKHRLELILFVAVIAGSPILNHTLKAFFQRARPEFHRLIEIGGYSFPSGHAMNALSVYAILTFLLWRHISTRTGRGLLLIFSTMMILTIGVSRIYLGVHYPSDIVAGYFAGCWWVASAIWVFQKYQDWRYRKEK